MAAGSSRTRRPRCPSHTEAAKATDWDQPPGPPGCIFSWCGQSRPHARQEDGERGDATPTSPFRQEGRICPEEPLAFPRQQRGSRGCPWGLGAEGSLLAPSPPWGRSPAQLVPLPHLPQVTFTDIGLTARDNEGATALHFAARGGHTPILDRLLLMGAPVMTDSWGGTPLHDAAENGQLEVIQAMWEATR